VNTQLPVHALERR